MKPRFVSIPKKQMAVGNRPDSDIMHSGDGSIHVESGDSWNQLLNDKFGSIRVEPQLERGFAAMLTAKDAGEISMMRCVSKPATVIHNPAWLPGKRVTDYMIKTQVKGTTKLNVDGQQLLMRPGDYIICDNSRTYSLDFQEETAIISIPLSSEYLRKFSPFPQDVAFLPVDNSNPVRRVAYDYLDSLWRNNASDLYASTREKLASTFLELAVLSIAEQKNQQFPVKASHRELFNRCCQYIDKNFIDETLAPAQIAQTNGISLRYLQSIFAEQETTVNSYLLEKRLNEAMKILKSQIYASRTISEIAYSLGFKSLASFSRSFKEYYGMSPKSARNMQ